MLAEAFREGDIPYSTVRFLIEYVTEENELQLVELARRLCFSELKKALAGVDSKSGEGKNPDDPFFTLKRRADGMVFGDYLIPPVVGAYLESALKIAELVLNGHTAADSGQLRALIAEAMAHSAEAGGGDPENGVCEDDLLFDGGDCAAPGPEDATEVREQDGGEAQDMVEEEDTWIDAAFGDTSFEDEESDTPPEEARPAVMTQPPRKSIKMGAEEIFRVPSRFGPPQKQNLYAAFIAMLNIVRAQPIAATRAPGADVSIIVTEDGRAWMPQNPQIPSRVLTGYVHNALARAHLLSSSGVTLHYGRKRRTASDGQIKALLELWGYQCAMPGCTHSRFMEIHHIRDWAEGGSTDIENLIPLCSSCHSQVSHGNITVTSYGRDIEFAFSDGSRYTSYNHSLPELTQAAQLPIVDVPSP
ncbi:HNH endonuclease signature motif containing protein [Corynebacterium aquatimens]|uniref:HNH endonuclease signature motif containing protein n=1 Tax=Corynebacterium aquatimens TaxID=1190508 RepID=UPI00253F7F45|nr:HNH endonuclease signature motif containing protein [Corynebacterium aquatimens]